MGLYYGVSALQQTSTAVVCWKTGRKKFRFKNYLLSHIITNSELKTLENILKAPWVKFYLI